MDGDREPSAGARWARSGNRWPGRATPAPPTVGAMDEPDDSRFADWAEWFKCLADPTRLRILHFVSGLDEPITVGGIVEALRLTQSNVSHHLRILAEQQFVLLEAEGVRTLVSVNRRCMVELPDAAAAIMQADRAG